MIIEFFASNPSNEEIDQWLMSAVGELSAFCAGSSLMALVNHPEAFERVVSHKKAGPAVVGTPSIGDMLNASLRWQSITGHNGWETLMQHGCIETMRAFAFNAPTVAAAAQSELAFQAMFENAADLDTGTGERPGEYLGGPAQVDGDYFIIAIQGGAPKRDETGYGYFLGSSTPRTITNMQIADESKQVKFELTSDRFAKIFQVFQSPEIRSLWLRGSTDWGYALKVIEL